MRILSLLVAGLGVVRRPRSTAKSRFFFGTPGFQAAGCRDFPIAPFAFLPAESRHMSGEVIRISSRDRALCYV
jgi:hypothetical protein